MREVVVAERTHEVQFYDDASFLADRVVTFVRDALTRDGAAIVIARPANLAAVEVQLRERGVDVEGARASGRLVMVDAHITLATFMDDGVPDPALFDRHVAALVRRTTKLAGGGPTHAYGEMVDVLWEQGHHEAVVDLERLWGKLLAAQTFSLLCGYRFDRFNSDSAGFDHVCKLHDNVASQHAEVRHAQPDVAKALVQLEQRARVLEVEVERRNKLEQRMFGLLELSGQLTASQSREEVARIAIEAGKKAVEASAAALWVVSADGQHLELLASTDGVSADKFSRIPLDGDVPITTAVLENRPIFLGSLATYQQQFPASFARSKTLRAPDQVAYAILPVAGDARPVGGIWFAYDRERSFTGVERTFKEIVARHCGLALERVDLQDKERRARAESELLYAMTSEIAVAEDLDGVYDIALTTVERGASCDRAAILLFDDTGVMRFKAWHGLSDSYRAVVDGHSPWKPEERNPIAIAINDTDLDPAWASYRDVFRAEGLRSLAFVPLVHERKLIGKFMLYRNEPRAFTPRELQLATTVAFHVAEALSHKHAQLELARAYAEEKDAHATAEEATRAREEILSVVSHDLRNPLGAILLGASSLLQIDAGGHRVAGIAGRIHRQAERMARLIDDLVDFAGIQAGKLAIAPTDHRPGDLLHAANDMFAPIAQERGLVLATSVQADLPSIRCDSERALQVISNLVSNAFKVTPKGGHVRIGAEARDNDIVFFVRDDGPGIESAELPKLFERYWRGKTSQYRGAGLGLSIARGIVDAHGGKIWAESTVGVGSTFYFSLQPRN
jgi:signal transduction histidine kinase